MKKQKQMVSLTLAATMVISGMPTGPAVSFAAETNNNTSAVEFTLNAEDLLSSMEHAVSEGAEIQKEDLAITDGDVEQIEGTLFDGGTLYELAPQLEVSGRDGDTGLKVYLNVPDSDEVEKYGISGEENLIFLYENYGTDTVKYTVSVEDAMGIGSGNFKVKTLSLASYAETFGWADENDEYASDTNASKKKSTKDLAVLNGDSTVKAYRTKVSEVLNLEKLTVDEAAVPATMSMKMILAANADETVNVQIKGAGDYEGQFDLPVGNIAENAPNYSEDGYEYVNATIGNIAIHEVGKYEGATYYTTKASGDTAMLLKDSETIVLNYEQSIQIFNITYQKPDDVIIENNPDKVQKNGSYRFFVTPPKGKKISVYINNETDDRGGMIVDSASGKTMYTVNDVNEEQNVRIEETDIQEYTFKFVPDADGDNQGSAQIDNSAFDMEPGGSVTFYLTGDDPSLDGVHWYEWRLNSLTINGKDINLPGSYDELTKDPITTNLYTEEGKEIVSVALVTREYHKYKGKKYHYVYKITISNIYHDISIDNWNFKQEGRNEIVVKQMDGVKQLFGWDAYHTVLTKAKYKEIKLDGTTVLLQKDKGSSSDFYFKLEDGYVNPQVSYKVLGEDEVKIKELNNNKNNSSYPASEYPYAFDIPCEGKESIEVFIKAEPEYYKVKFDPCGEKFEYEDVKEYSTVKGKNHYIVLPANYPIKEDYVFAGWELDGELYSPNAEISVARVKDKAVDGTLTFTARWQGLADYVDYTVKTYLEERNPDGVYQYPSVETSSKSGEAIEDTTVTLTNPDSIEGYVLDTENSVMQKVMTADSSENVLKLYYAKDENKDGTADREQLVTIVLVSEYGFDNTDDTSYTIENLVPDLPMPANLPQPKQKVTGYAFDCWDTADGKLPTNVPNGVEKQTYKAQYEKDENGNGIPDSKETKVKITIISDYGFDGSESSPYVLNDQLPGIPLVAPKPLDTEDDNRVFTGWEDEKGVFTENLPGEIPSTDKTYKAVYEKDENNNGRPDSEESTVTITVESEYGFENSSAIPPETIKYEMLPGAKLSVSDEPKKSVDGYVYVGWDTEDGNLPEKVPEKSTTYTAVYKEDRNHNGTPDEEETKVTLTFVSENGFEKNEGTTVVLKDQLPGVEFTGPVPADTNTDGVVFTGWDTENGKLPTTVPAENTTYTAQYAVDKNNNGTADDGEQKITLTFVSDHGFKGQESNSYVLKDLLSGMPFTAPEPEDTDNDGVKFVGWDTENGTLPTVVPTSNTTYTAKYVDDKNNNGIDDATEKKVTITFVSEHGFDGVESPYVLENQLPGTELTAPVPTDTNRDSVVFVGWDTEDGNIPSLVPADDTVYTAKYETDRNNNGVPDKDERRPTTDCDDREDTITTPDSKFSYVVGVDGNWSAVSNEEHIWNFVLKDGTILKDRWAYIKNPYAAYGQPESGWFHFDGNGKMTFGWYLDTKTGDWYVCYDISDGMLGTMLTGWYDDKQDGERYYLDPVSGKMLTGWQYIGGKWYYFNTVAQEPTWTYDGITWKHNGSTSKPYGAMYRNETTPDGYQVGEDGSWK